MDESATPITLLSPRPRLLRRESYIEPGSLLGHDRNYITLLFVPAGIVLGILGFPSVVVFVLNFLALIPLALLVLEMAIQLSYHAGTVKGGLLRAVLGNTVELLVRIIELRLEASWGLAWN